jgi:hypothetical protein
VIRKLGKRRVRSPALVALVWTKERYGRALVRSALNEERSNFNDETPQTLL